MSVPVETLIDRSIRNMGSGIHPRVKEYAIELIKRSYKKGIFVQISSGYRSLTEQAGLYGKGRSSYVYKGKQYGKPRDNIVTNAMPGQSVHNYGLAIDYFLLTPSGVGHWDITRDLNSNQVQDWFEVAAIGKQMGFQWGGDWRSFRDYPHLDMQKGLSLAQLATGKRPNLPPLSSPTPAPGPVDPATKGYLIYDDRGKAVEDLQTYLNRVGYEVEIHGYYNAETKRAVMDFQKSRGLVDDGVYGPQSKAEMNKALKEQAAVKPAAPKEEEEDEKLELSARQRQEIAANFKVARERGVFSSDAHEKAILDGTMTQSQLNYLNNLIAGAALIGGKRIDASKK